MIEKVRVGINGIGEIGRPSLWALTGSSREKYPRLELTGINNRSPLNDSLLGFDSVTLEHHGGYRLGGGKLITPSNLVDVYQETAAEKIPWEIDLAIESTGAYETPSKAKAHLDNRGKFVLVTGPFDEKAGKVDHDLYPTMVFGVNHRRFDPRKHQIVSAASCTTAALTLTVTACGFDHNQWVSVDTVHSVTPSQNLLDGTNRKPQLSFGTGDNIILTSTGAAKAATLVLPEFAKEVTATSERVDAQRGSLLITHFGLEKPVKREEVVERVLRATTEGSLCGLIAAPRGGEEPKTVKEILTTRTSPFRGVGAVILPDRIEVLGNGFVVKVSTWYDNIGGFTAEMLRLANFMAERALDAGVIRRE